MLLFYTDQFVLPLPDGHTFPMSKYRLLRERVLASGLVGPDSLIVPHAAPDNELALAHDPDYVAAMSAGTVGEPAMKKIGFPWSAFLVERSRRSSGATIDAARASLADGYSVNLAGGTHHAFRDHGEGYCLFNDSVIASRQLQREGLVQRVLVIDLDVHQGNGTASICREDPSIYTFSVHGAKNYPLQKEQSDLDVELPDGTSDRDYLDALAPAMRRAIDETSRRRELQHQYNLDHGITPQSIIKPIEATLVTAYEADYFKVPLNLDEFEGYSRQKIEETINSLDHEMREAARKFEFEKAASLRDKIKYLRDRELV